MKKILLFLCILLLPLNTFAYSDYVVLGGKTLGIKVDTKGIMVIGFYKVDGKFNKGSPAMQNGDYIISVEDEYVNNKKKNLLKLLLLEMVLKKKLI